MFSLISVLNIAKIATAVIDPMKKPIACIENESAIILPRFFDKENSETMIAFIKLRVFLYSFYL